ncbi:MAG: modulated sigma54 specific transcriptional regulator, Fis family [Myxococcaceae bacterium]|nr:modulated sigma54 specific transcriptional regulator, Fis family [Myxococcaceae bacterium]
MMTHTTQHRTVAVVDDDAALCLALRSLLRSDGHDVEVYGSAEDYLDSSRHDPDCLIVDVSMPGRSGPELVNELRGAGREVPAIFISAHEMPGDPAAFRDATHSAFLRKPFADDELLATVRAALVEAKESTGAQSPVEPDRAPATLAKEPSMSAVPLRAVDNLRTEAATVEPASDAFSGIVGAQGGLSATVHRAQLLTRVHAPLLLQGETGVGKELFARAIHAAVHGRTSQSDAPFVVLNCAGLPRDLLASELFGYVAGAFAGAREGGVKGRIEAADGGTLFLDEISELPLDLQAYLLRVLESGEFYPLGITSARRASFRLIAASSRDLRSEVNHERFRSDLFFRISVTALAIPALRERAEDLPALVQHFAQEASARHQLPPTTFQPDVMEAFARYSWPGNVRELRNVVEQLCLLAENHDVDMSLLPEDFQPRSSLVSVRVGSEVGDVELPRGLQKVERAAIDDALRAYSGNLTRVARELQIARSTLYLKLKKYELEPVLNELRFGSR